MRRLSPHVVVEGEPDASVAIDRRTGDRYPISSAARALLDAVAAGRPSPGRPDVEGLLADAVLERLGALVADEPASRTEPAEPAWTEADPCWLGPWHAERDGAPGVVFMGLPWDFGMGERGAASGPAILRATGPAFRPSASRPDDGWPGWYSYALGRDVLAGVPVRDAGDLAGPVIADYELVEHLLAEALAPALHGGPSPAERPLPVFVGGDHGLTRSILRSLGRALPRPPRTLVMLDAHDDFEPSSAPDHGSFVRALVEGGVVDAVRLVGVRGLARAGRGQQLAAAGIGVLTAAEAVRASPDTLEAWAASLPPGPVYLSIDVDVLDPSLAPGTRCLRAGGLSLDDAVRVITAVARHRPIEVLDLMELGLPRGPLDLTPLVAAELLLVAAGLALESRRPLRR